MSFETLLKISRLLVMVLPSVSFADVNIVAPTAYENGDPLLADDIDHYNVCFSLTDSNICDSEINVTGEVIADSQIPERTHYIKARTVTVYGEVGGYSNIVELNRKPGSPELKHKKITTTTVTTTIVSGE